MFPFTKKHWPCNNMESEGLFGQAVFPFMAFLQLQYN